MLHTSPEMLTKKSSHWQQEGLNKQNESLFESVEDHLCVWEREREKGGGGRCVVRTDCSTILSPLIPVIGFPALGQPALSFMSVPLFLGSVFARVCGCLCVWTALRPTTEGIQQTAALAFKRKLNKINKPNSMAVKKWVCVYMGILDRPPNWLRVDLPIQQTSYGPMHFMIPHKWLLYRWWMLNCKGIYSDIYMSKGNYNALSQNFL